ncbi:MAG: hypothetical protein KKA73_15585, partial [Chloroflexi bacterium]|nr:hypothetical protein [Chloroflexota bacterium]
PLLACPICPICGQPTAPPAPGQPAVAFACPTVPSHWIEWRAAQVLTKRCAQRPWPEWTAADRAAWLQDRYQDLLDLYRDGPSIFS